MLNRLIDDLESEFPAVVEVVRGFPDASLSVKTIRKSSNGWLLGTKGGQTLGPFDVVVGGFAQHCLTDPFLKSGGKASERMLRCLRRVESNQLIAMQVSFEGEPLPMDFVAAHVYGEEALSWICNNSGKPQQNGQWGTPGPQHLTLISTAGFAEREFNCNPTGYRRIAEERMLEALARVLGIRDLGRHRPQINRINHWEDGLPTTTPPDSQGCLLDADEGLGWCGDFCVAPGIQGAAMSGLSMAGKVGEYLRDGADIDRRGLLPDQLEWRPVRAAEGVVDIGAFSPALKLPGSVTHTDLVPSAIDGYDPAAHTGAAGRGAGKGKGKSHAKGKPDSGYGPTADSRSPEKATGGYGSSKGTGKGKGKGRWKGGSW